MNYAGSDVCSAGPSDACDRAITATTAAARPGPVSGSEGPTVRSARGSGKGHDLVRRLVRWE